jgi:DNA-binding XRE family transcriptional regulator
VTPTPRLSREYVNKIEAGRYDPPLSTLNSIAKARGVPVTELLG